MSSEQPVTYDRELDASALKALSHPLRLEIYDLLSQYGPQTASSLAQHVGESSGATSYHLRELAKHDLIEEATDLGTARERWWRRPPGSVHMGGEQARKTPAGQLASSLVVEEFYRRRHGQLISYLRSIVDVESDADVHSLLTTSAVALTVAQFEELSGKIESLIQQTVDAYRDQSSEGTSVYLVRADIFPLPDFADEV